MKIRIKKNISIEFIFNTDINVKRFIYIVPTIRYRIYRRRNLFDLDYVFIYCFQIAFLSYRWMLLISKFK